MKKKIVGIIIIVAVVLYLVSRVYCFVVISKVHKAIEQFRAEENRSYVVITENYNGHQSKIEILVKDDIVKCNTKNNNGVSYCEWKSLEIEQEYSINLRNKTFRSEELLDIDRDSLKSLPILIKSIYQDNQFHLKEFLKIAYIIPIEYNNQKCYKIVTETEELIVDGENYLPIYCSVKLANSNENKTSLIENTYEFKVGEVTDEEIALPDLTEFTEISE